jgi:hypothetical protein
MRPFPFPSGSTPGDISIVFCQDHGGMTLTITDEGAGYFLTLKTDGDGVGLDPKEIVAIAQWAADACAEMDGAAKP